jgi:hypothetical protein
MTTMMVATASAGRNDTMLASSRCAGSGHARDDLIQVSEDFLPAAIDGPRHGVNRQP